MDQEGKKDPIDLSNILLPKKTTPGTSVDSASRANAGALLESEQTATLPVPPKPAAPPPLPKKDEQVVQPLQTFQGDIEAVIEKQNTSVVSMAAAEATRLEKAAKMTQVEPRAWVNQTVNTMLVGGGILLLLGALAAVLFVLRPPPSVTIAQQAPAPFIYIDETYGFSVPLASFKRSTAMNALEEQRQKISLSLGLMARIYLAIPPTSDDAGPTPLSVTQLLKVLAPNAPDVLLRSLDQYEYLLGIHSYDENQAVLILKTQSYEQAFAGMLQWEPFMRQDLMPLFNRVPPQYVSEDGTPVTLGNPQNKFVDRILENHDTRVIENEFRDIYLLWSFIDRNTLVITTNEATFREVISRIKNSPIVPLP